MLQNKRRDYKIAMQYNILVTKRNLKQKNKITFTLYRVALQHFLIIIYEVSCFLSNLLNIPVSL